MKMFPREVRGTFPEGVISGAKILVCLLNWARQNFSAGLVECSGFSG